MVKFRGEEGLDYGGPARYCFHSFEHSVRIKNLYFLVLKENISSFCECQGFLVLLNILR